MVQPIDFGQFYNPLYLFISFIGVLAIGALIYVFGLKAIIARQTPKSKARSKKSARAAAAKQSKVSSVAIKKPVKSTRSSSTPKANGAVKQSAKATSGASAKSKAKAA